MFTRNIKQSVLLGKSGVRWQVAPAPAPTENVQSLVEQINAQNSAQKVLDLVKNIDFAQYSKMTKEDKAALTAAHLKIETLTT